MRRRRRRNPPANPWLVVGGLAAAAGLIWYFLQNSASASAASPTMTAGQLNQLLQQGSTDAAGVTTLPGGSLDISIPAGQ